MPSLLDYKDSKNIIIYLFMVLLALATYVYKGDQSAISERDKAAEKSVAENHLKLEALLKKECATISIAVAATVTDQKEMRQTIAALKAKQISKELGSMSASEVKAFLSSEKNLFSKAQSKGIAVSLGEIAKARDHNTFLNYIATRFW